MMIDVLKMAKQDVENKNYISEWRNSEGESGVDNPKKPVGKAQAMFFKALDESILGAF